MIIWMIEESYGKKITSREYFETEEELKERVKQRKRFPYGTTKWDIVKIDLPKDIHKLNAFWNYMRERDYLAQVKDLKKRTTEVRKFVIEKLTFG